MLKDDPGHVALDALRWRLSEAASELTAALDARSEAGTVETKKREAAGLAPYAGSEARRAADELAGC